MVDPDASICRRRGTWLIGACALMLAGSIPACTEPKPKPGGDVLSAWSQAPPPKRQSQPAKPTRAPQLVSDDANSNAIAYVEGRPIDRDRVVSLLLSGHGVGVLEQVVVLEKAKMLAEEQGIAVTDRDIDAEFERSLRNLTSSLHAAGEASFDREQAEQVLDEVLSRRNVSRAECMAMVERNAYLRAICRANMTFSDEQIAEEYQRAYGPRVQVRHIQLGSLADAERVLSLLRASGDFATLAEGYSANLLTAPAGGLLRPFAHDDPDVPAALADTAFKLEVGQVSDPVRVDEWYHLIRVEKRIPPDERPIDEVRGELEGRLRERLTEPAMQTLYRTLFAQADIRVVDPVLAAEFEHKHPERSASGP